ncbi:MAG: molybdopterin-dependent oxidoreductase [Hydrogenobacter thermophilus]|uniref:dissimilatory nitrate reductase subunit NarH n=1 Tax=Hydrogenobacter thermophilus TaxID=940 RepID=UPI001C75037E|nr:dissimilatory nitrate reductase subunit NarH [Hydrogenobacter thermophilus]QWK19211.1 MAG: molybdopterin-dependent oxidoreductase [Hydrogenobacter thermophilus]
MSDLTRRDLLKMGGLSLTAMLSPSFAFRVMEPVVRVENPLAYYPNRDWERFYRDIFKSEATFTFLCAPNDTHNCLLTAHVKNGVITRIEPTYKFGEATDIYGLKASHRWDPRCCNKGLALMRRFYGDRRVKGPMVRRGFYEWYKAGFPRDPITGKPPEKYFQRGKDKFIKVTWDEVADIIAKTLINIATTYSGEEGRKRLEAQGHYPKPMLDAMEGAGTRVLKFRGSMPFLAVVRYTSPYRFANMMALLDSHIRGVGPDKALGGRGWDNYAFHTDLAPGHPMVSGQQNVEFDLCMWEHSKLIILWGMNPFTTKMPDCHWLTEARIKGSKVIVISNDYSPTARASDELIVVRTGTDTALALSIAYVIMKEKLYQERFVKSFTDMPLLVRMDNGKVLRARDIIPNYQPQPLQKAVVFKPGETLPPFYKQDKQYIPEPIRKGDMDDFVVWDTKSNSPKVITRDHVGEDFWKLGIDPALYGTYRVKTVEGKEVEVKPLFQVYLEFFEKSYTPKQAEVITGVPAKKIEKLAREIASHPRNMKLAQGMGVNQYQHADLKDRAMYMICALTDNIGHATGNIGSYAGNFRLALFNGAPQYLAEDPFNIELDPEKPAKVKFYWKPESAHYYSHDDHPQYMGEHLITGKTHMPTPTKFVWFVDANSALGNAKWQYNIIMNTLPKIECIVTNEWWWSMTCEYSDIVLGVDAWNENKYWDIAGSVTNPFVYVWPKTGHRRFFDTKNDAEAFAIVANRLSELTGDERFRNYWKFVLEGKQDVVYVQRVINASSNLRGYRLEEIAKKAHEGIPSLIMTRSYPKYVGEDQTKEGMPWYTKSGRLEFYREEPEFMDAGENLPVYREPIDSTHHEPNVIVARPHPLLRPKKPEDYGLSAKDALLSTEWRQARNVLVAPEKLPTTKHPLMVTVGATHIVHTPKYRHSAHTTTGDTDIIVLLFGPFGDIYRHDKRMPFVSEAYIDINPKDLKKMGIQDGDYVWVDADPQDRPFAGWQKRPEDYEVGRLLLRARASNNTPPGCAKIWFNMYGSSHGSVRGTKENPNGLAKNPNTGYQSLYRRGSHQSITRGWFKPTYQTDTLVRKNLMGQIIGKGFELDVHGLIGAPREGFSKITKAEDGGIGGKGVWRPVRLGYRPMTANEMLKKYLKGEYVK